MNDDKKITFIVIGSIIFLLIGIAFMMEPKGVSDLKESKKEETKNITQKIETTQKNTEQNTKPMEEKKYTQATLTTSKGVIEIEFTKNAPKTVENFTKLASTKFYDGVRFHRVIKDFMIQTGDPLSKDKSNIEMWGTGGPGYRFDDELSGNEKYPLGTVAMANAGANTNGSQFFIVTANPSSPLPPSYTVFANVISGIDVALLIQDVKTTGSPKDRPFEDIVIEKIELK